ncbi:MAG TPA: hypothetical protein VKA34_17510 [Balneolales bacterium]|nr:hypothetical protein [Balneolales bacterium]
MMQTFRKILHEILLLGLLGVAVNYAAQNKGQWHLIVALIGAFMPIITRSYVLWKRWGRKMVKSH